VPGIWADCAALLNCWKDALECLAGHIAGAIIFEEFAPEISVQAVFLSFASHKFLT
jgi:hypothetical protein